MESILPIALKLCARSPSILSDVSMLCQCRIEQDWNGKHWLSWTSSVLPPRDICQATCATTCASQWVVFALACLPAMCVKWQEETVGNHLRDAKAKFWQGTIARFWKIMEDLYYILLLCFCLCKNSYGIWGLGHFRAWAKSESRSCKTSWIESFWGVQKNGCGYLGCFHMQLEPENGDAREPRTVWLSQGGMSQNIEATIFLQQTASISLWCAACRFSMFPQCFTVLLFSLHELVVPLIQ